MSFKKLMLTAGGGGAGGWIVQYEPQGLTANPYVYFKAPEGDDDSGNLYAMTTNAGSDYDLIKMDSSGNVSAYSRVASTNGYGTNGACLAVDSSENLYVFNRAYPGNIYDGIAKYNSSLVEQNEQYYTRSSDSRGAIPTGIVKNGKIVVASVASDNAGSSGRQYGFVVTASTMGASSGHYFGGFDSNNVRTVYLDSSGNIYRVQGYRASSTGERAGIIKFGTTHSSMSWLREYPVGNSQSNDVDVDSSGNVYLCGRANEGSSAGFLAKFNSSGTNQWHKTYNTYGFVGGDSRQTIVSVKHTSHGIVTVTFSGYNVPSSYNYVIVSLWNASTGDLEEEYGIANTTSNFQVIFGSGAYHCPTTDEAVYIPARVGSDVFFMKLPIKDGSGIYGNYTLGSYNFTIEGTSLGNGNGSNSWGSFSESSNSHTPSRTTSTFYTDGSTTPTISKLDL